MFYKYTRIFYDTLFSIKAILWLRLCFGYYSEIVSSRLLRVLTRSYCAFYGLFSMSLMTYFLYISPNDFLSIFSFQMFAHFFINLFISFYTKDVAFQKFHAEILIIDKMLGVKSNFFNIKISTRILLLSFIGKIVSEFICFFRDISFFNTRHMLVVGMLLTNHLSLSTGIMLFELMYTRLNFIVKNIKINFENKRIPAKNKCLMLQKFLNMYKILLDNFSRNNNSLNVVVSFYNTIIIHIICESFSVCSHLELLTSKFLVLF